MLQATTKKSKLKKQKQKQLQNIGFLKEVGKYFRQFGPTKCPVLSPLVLREGGG